MKDRELSGAGGEKWRPPQLGQRIVKTTVAVFLCLLYALLRGPGGQNIAAEAAITAIVCMQPYVRRTGEYAINRFAGTLVGAWWGLCFLLFFLAFPAMSGRALFVYALMALGVLASLYTAVLIGKSDASGLAAIVYLCVVISFPDIEHPLRQALARILGVLLGTAIAIAVNVFRLPRDKDRDSVFFVRIRDLAPDRFSPVPSAALYRLNYLCQDGARICLMSEHAPAFFTLQMSEAMLRVPLIVMGGAAIYDADENRYLYAETIRPRDSAHLREHLDRQGLSYFIYTVHGHKTRIFHQGEFREEERVVYRRMKRSPYRDYLEDSAADPEEIVYLKLLGTEAQTSAWLSDLQSLIHSANLRAVIRQEAGTENIRGLYLYSERVSMKNAENRLMELLREKEPGLRAREVFLDRPYRSERDAMVLLHKLGDLYEPVRLPWKKRKTEEKA